MNLSNVARALFWLGVAYLGAMAARREARRLEAQIRATLPVVT